MNRPIAWHEYTADDLKKLNDLCNEYRVFLDESKTERECVNKTINLAEAKGYKNISEYLSSGQKLKAGDKIYAVNMKKAVVLFNVGTEDIVKGMNILGAHIDSPRIDVKQNPLYEDSSLAYLDTHYYGGIKKYQWVAMPLALHGVVALKNGTVVDINIGEKETDPVFCITDLLPHLGKDQMEKKASVVIEGEHLDLLIGSQPLNDSEKNGVVARIKSILNDSYGIEEEDFLSAELEIVPAGKARDMGLDRSMILAYGQDDRVCAFTSLKAMLDVENPHTTTCCLLVDKEEIGSYGATGMQSKWFENTCAEILELMGNYTELTLRRMLQNSKMLSSDVNAGYDPLYSNAYEKKNTAFLGKGVVFAKYTGARGKSGSSDANAEYMAYIRKIMDEANVFYQTAELGKVDFGGGGTIAFIMAVYGMEVIDCGVGVLSMHAPWEVTSKADIFEAKKCYEAFLKA